MQANIKNRTIFCKDNLEVLRGINSSCIDLIYLDPPFNKNKVFTAPIGSSAEGASFKDYFREKDVKEEWVQTIKEDHEKLYAFLESVKVFDGKRSYNFCYLTYMAIRLMECQRVLKDTGSIYLHCDSTMSHYLKLLMDILFGETNFRNEIVWCYSQGGKSSKNFGKKHDVILRYTRSDHFVFNGEEVSIEMKSGKESFGGKFETDEEGRTYRLVYGTKNSKGETKYYKYYLDEGKIPEDYWVDINSIQSGSKERTGYPTQKPLALLERIVKASSHEGDMVLDPFCGCATTCVVAEKLARQWVGVDVSHLAYDLVKQRLEKEVIGIDSDGQTDLLKHKNEILFTTIPPERTDPGDYRGVKKYLYVISNKQYKDEFKVGIASDVKSRLNSYQTSDPNRAYKLEFSLLTSSFREIETHIHEKFENRHEWVRGDLHAIIQEIENYR